MRFPIASLALLAVTSVAHAQLGDAPRQYLPPAHGALKIGTQAVSRAEIIERYHTQFLPTESVLTGWTGNVAGCNAGTTSAAFKQAVIDRVNYYRLLAGLPPVVQFGASQTTDAQNAALMMSANNQVSHSPPPSWLCYTASGANAAANSNLALGAFGVDAIDIYMDDAGAGNDAVGHRRWLLFPPQTSVATGDIPTSGGNAANALWVLGPFGGRPSTPNGVAWPPQGYVPWDLLPAGSNRWSFSYPGAVFGIDGDAPLAFAQLYRYNTLNIPVNYELVHNGYGDETLVFKPTGFPYGPPATDTLYLVNVSNVGGGGPSAFTYTTRVIDAEQLPGGMSADFNGDGKADLLWHNAATGETAIGLMNGAGFSSGAIVMSNPAWRPVITGDFNGDGMADIVWENNATGQTAIWLMNGVQFTSGAIVLTDPNWRVNNVGDFNADGKSDLVWYNAVTHEISVWLMNGTQFSSGTTSSVYGPVVKVADLDGDGKDDIIVRQDDNGATNAYLMLGSHPVTGTNLLLDPNWAVVATPDLDGDGQADLVWYNASTGVTSAWLMNGLTPKATGTLLSDPNWRVTDTADFNADGKDDLLWRNRATGQTAMWLMNGLSFMSGSILLTDPNWQVAKVGNFNGDVATGGGGGGAKPYTDLLWRNTQTGQHAVWLMNGAQFSSGAIVLNSTAWWPSP
jgi:uncharacterized protein YkwD